MRFNTDLLHAGVVREANGATLPPVYQSSAFEQDTAADLEKIFENKAPGYCYTRVGNPTVTESQNWKAAWLRSPALPVWRRS